MATQPPGWYPDPLSPKGMQRRWDGQDWTSDVRPSHSPPASVGAAGADRPANGAQEPGHPAIGVISCIDCGGKVSVQAPACIHCGRPNQSLQSQPVPGPTGRPISPGLPPPGTVSPNVTNPPGGVQSGATGSSGKSKDVVSIAALALGVVALVLSFIAFRGSGIATMVMALVAIIATFVVSGQARRMAEKRGTRRSWMVLVGVLLAWGSLVLLGLAIFQEVMSRIPA